MPPLRPPAMLTALLVLCSCGAETTSTTSTTSGTGGATAGAGGAGGGVGLGGAGGAGQGGQGAQAGQGADGGHGGEDCQLVDAQTPLVIANASAADEHALELWAVSTSHTSWAEPGNEALVLEVRVDDELRGHLVLHQGADGLVYGMHLGALAAGQQLSVLVSDTLSASAAERSACVGPATLRAAASVAEPEGLRHAPILKWPVAKRFDDLPLVLGWSAQRSSFQAVYTNEDGGTVELCGGGAEGIQAEIARWGRAIDIEGLYRIGGATPEWERCTGMTSTSDHAVRYEGAHPLLYYGDGHNRLFESRGGYGQSCGSASDEKADGNLQGWNVDNPGNGLENDGPYTIVLRPLPVSLDALGFAEHTGRREALADRHAPWIYRLLDHELAREGKIDQVRTFGMQQYLYADIYAADVGGSGDQYCELLGVDGGFKLRARVGATNIDGPQMTADYFGGADNVKRIAIPLPQLYQASAFDGLVFDAYDDDGSYWLALGDLFIPRPSGDNGAFIDLVHSGVTDINVYVDDDESGCSSGFNADGPAGPAACVGSFHLFDL